MDNTGFIRAERLDEKYYARRNAPTWHQLAGKSHFIDDSGRQYTLAPKNKETFQNERVQFKPRHMKRDTIVKKREITINSAGAIKFFVRLATSQSRWFGARDIDRSLTLHHKDEQYIVRIKSTDKPDPRSATGAVYIKGLSRELCETLLNQ